MAGQEQALNTKTEAHEIYHTEQDPRCRLCKQHTETVVHIISGCSKLAGTEYTKRHNNVALIVYRAICGKYNLEHSKDWWVEPEKVLRNDHAKILWYFLIQTDKHSLHNRPDIVLINYREQTSLIIVIADSKDEKIQNKKLEKIDSYQLFKIKLEQL